MSRFTAAVILGWATSALAAPISLTASRDFDEQTNQSNAVNTNASGNVIGSVASTDYAGFKTAINNAYDANLGGVVNFDLPNAATADITNHLDGFNVGYGGGKSLALAVTTGGASPVIDQHKVNVTVGSTLTPVSGSSTNSKLLIASNSSVTAMRFTFGAITNGTPGEYVKQVSFALLSRDSKAQSVLVQAYADGQTSTAFASDTEAIAAGKTVDDTFFSFIAPEGSYLSSIRIGFDTANVIGSDDRLGIDDLAFITVPEPATLSLLTIAALPLLRRRRG